MNQLTKILDVATVGLGVVFGALIFGVGRNPAKKISFFSMYYIGVRPQWEDLFICIEVEFPFALRCLKILPRTVLLRMLFAFMCLVTSILYCFYSFPVNTSILPLTHKIFSHSPERNLGAAKLAPLGQIRYYATSSKAAVPLNPGWITGFVDGEGCFTINVHEDNRQKTGWQVQLRFAVGLHEKDRVLLEKIKEYWGADNITKLGSQSIHLRISSRKGIAKIINHLDKFQLVTQKQADYILWRTVFYLMENNEHLTVDGLNKIAGLKEQHNRGLTPKLESAFPNRTPVKRSLVLDQTIQDPDWLAGFTSAEGCFMVKIKKSKTHSTGFQVWLVFQLTQHERDEKLMISFIDYFNCGITSKDRAAFNFLVSKFSDLIDKIIPFFQKYPIEGVKAKDFEDFCRVAEMMKEKRHLTPEGLEQIKKIKVGMNKVRKEY